MRCTFIVVRTPPALPCGLDSPQDYDDVGWVILVFSILLSHFLFSWVVCMRTLGIFWSAAEDRLKKSQQAIDRFHPSVDYFQWSTVASPTVDCQWQVVFFRSQDDDRTLGFPRWPFISNTYRARGNLSPPQMSLPFPVSWFSKVSFPLSPYL